MNELTIKTAISDGIDRLSILIVKEKKINNNEKLVEIRKEKKMLEESLKDKLKFDVIKYYYRLLCLINEKIWDLLDEAKYNSKTEKDELKNYREQEDYNERRFRVKKKIDDFTESNIKEQKGYKKNTAFVLMHLGLGDHGYMIGMVRYLSTKYDSVIVVCYNKNKKNMELFFKDDRTIELMGVESNEDISPNRGFSMEKFLEITKGMDLYLSGCHSLTKPYKIYDYPFCFYDDVGIEHSVFWDYGYIPKSDNALQVYYSIPIEYRDNYVFVHNSASTGIVYTLEDMEEKLNIKREEMLFINPCYNVYKEGDKFYEIAETFLGHRLPEYIFTIENAKYVSLSDSSFLGMAWNLNIKTDNCYYLGRDLNYDHLYNEKYKPRKELNKMKFKNLGIKSLFKN